MPDLDILAYLAPVVTDAFRHYPLHASLIAILAFTVGWGCWVVRTSR